MEIQLLQTDIYWEEPWRNRDHIGGLIYGSAPADIVILPEMFTTGFSMNPGLDAGNDGALTIEWMMAVARERNSAVAGSVAVGQGGKFFNRFYFIRPDGTVDSYDKRHLFKFGGENEAYVPGNGRTVVEYGGFRILLQICYDLRFPVYSRNMNDYDMVLYVANWPRSRVAVWETLLRARAIENVAYVAGVNRVGTDPSAVYGGQSMLIDFKGDILARAGDKEESVVVRVEIDRLREFRHKFNTLDDADKFTIEGYNALDLC